VGGVGGGGDVARGGAGIGPGDFGADWDDELCGCKSSVGPGDSGGGRGGIFGGDSRYNLVFTGRGWGFVLSGGWSGRVRSFFAEVEIIDPGVDDAADYQIDYDPDPDGDFFVGRVGRGDGDFWIHIFLGTGFDELEVVTI